MTSPCRVVCVNANCKSKFKKGSLFVLGATSNKTNKHKTQQPDKLINNNVNQLK